MITTEYLSGLKKFNLAISKKVTSKYIGIRPSLFAGRGATLRDHRIYSPGDDFRLIDWKIYARTDDLYVKRFEEERNLVVHVVVDNSASMNYGKPKKFDYGAMLGVGFAYLAIRENEKFQFASFSEKIEIFHPKKGLNHLALMVDHLNSLKTKGKSRFIESLGSYKKTIGSRAMVVVISDFLFDPKEIEEGLSVFAGNDLRVIMVLDKSEKKLDLQGDVKLTDAETNQMIRTYINPRTKTEYQHRLDAHIGKIKEICGKLKANFHVVTTDTPIFDTFYEVLQ